MDNTGTTGDPDRKHALHHVVHCDTRAHGTCAPKPANLCSLSPLYLGCPRASPPPRRTGGTVRRVLRTGTFTRALFCQEWLHQC